MYLSLQSSVFSLLHPSSYRPLLHNPFPDHSIIWPSSAHIYSVNVILSFTRNTRSTYIYAPKKASLPKIEKMCIPLRLRSWKIQDLELEENRDLPRYLSPPRRWSSRRGLVVAPPQPEPVSTASDRYIVCFFGVRIVGLPDLCQSLRLAASHFTHISHCPCFFFSINIHHPSHQRSRAHFGISCMFSCSSLEVS